MVKCIQGFTGYKIYADGVIVSRKQPSNLRKLKPRTVGNGYKAVMLCENGDTFQYYIHRLVAEHFIRPLREGEQVNHIDGNKTNNDVRNLEIVTPMQNSQHAWRTGLSNRAQGNRCKLTTTQVNRIKELREKGLLLREIATIFNVSEGTISMICNGVTWNE